MKKQKLLIVGSFPPGNRNIYGGIAKSSEILIQSEYFSKFNIIKLDSSQISNPPPSLPIRLLLSFSRIPPKYFTLCGKSASKTFNLLTMEPCLTSLSPK